MGDQRTDGPTDGPIDRPTDRPSYRDAWTHLKLSTTVHWTIICPFKFDCEQLLSIFFFLQEKDKSSSSLSLFDRAKLGVHSLIKRVGFFGILACASIPNPLFDLAGITCGHFLVPFWTFFGATLIGKGRKAKKVVIGKSSLIAIILNLS